MLKIKHFSETNTFRVCWIERERTTKTIQKVLLDKTIIIQETKTKTKKKKQKQKQIIIDRVVSNNIYIYRERQRDIRDNNRNIKKKRN